MTFKLILLNGWKEQMFWFRGGGGGRGRRPAKQQKKKGGFKNHTSQRRHTFCLIVILLKGIVHYLTMHILTEQGVYGHHNGVILSFWTCKHNKTGLMRLRIKPVCWRIRPVRPQINVLIYIFFLLLSDLAFVSRGRYTITISIQICLFWGPTPMLIYWTIPLNVIS